MAGLRVVWLDAQPDPRSGVFPAWLFSSGSGNSYSESVTDSVTGADSLGVQATFVAGLTDDVAAGDAIVAGISIALAVTDAAAGGDSLSPSTAFSAGLTDAATGSDSISAGNSIALGVTDAATGGDTPGAQAAFSVPVVDGATGTDSAGAQAAFTVGVTDGTSGGDSVQTGDAPQITETVTAGETVAAMLGVSVSMSDAILVGDTVVVSATFGATVIDTVAGSDSLGGNAFEDTVSGVATARDRVSSAWTRYRATTWAGTKRVARRAVHEAFAVAARYQDSQMAEPADLTVRWHAKGLQSLGDIQNDGFAEMLTRPDRLVFWREELEEAGIRLRHGGRVELTEYGGAVLVLDTEEPADGPGAVAWTVARANPDETFS